MTIQIIRKAIIGMIAPLLFPSFSLKKRTGWGSKRAIKNPNKGKLSVDIKINIQSEMPINMSLIIMLLPVICLTKL